MPRSIGIVTAADSRERSHGQLHIYDGEGKGKSQAALGVVLRTIGLGICEHRRTRVLLLRFLKGPGRAYDEDAAIEALQQGFPHLIDHLRTGRADHFTADEATRFDRDEAQRGWVIAKGAIASALYSVVVLDELNPVLELGLLDIDDVVRTLNNRPEGMEIIVTGRAAPAEGNTVIIRAHDKGPGGSPGSSPSGCQYCQIKGAIKVPARQPTRQTKR